MKKILAILANNSGFGGAANINEAFTLYSKEYDTVEITLDFAPYDFGMYSHGKRLSARKDPKSIFNVIGDKNTYLFIVDLSGLVVFNAYLSGRYSTVFLKPYDMAEIEQHNHIDKMIEELSERKICFFFSGTRYLQHHEVVNEWVRRTGCKMNFAMPDLIRCNPNAVPLYQPYALKSCGQKFDTFTASHSPGSKMNTKEVLGKFWNEKGSEEIVQVFDELKQSHGIESKVHGGNNSVDHKMSILTKDMSHVFVDKVSNHSAGIGKSGLEAIALGTPVISSMQHTNNTGHYSDIPVMDVQDKTELKECILKCFQNKRFYNKQCRDTKKWAEKINYPNTVKYIEENFIWD